MSGPLLTRLRFFLKPKPGSDIDEELRLHVEAAVETNLTAGMNPAEARRKAMVDFGGVQSARERCNDARPTAAFDRLRQDVHYALRTLRRDRGFAIVSTLILALSIGANIVVFSLVNTILLRPLPFYNPERLAWIAPVSRTGGLSGATYSVDAYEDLRAMNTSFADVTGYYAFSTPNNIKLTEGAISSSVTSISVAGNFFHVLGVTPKLGRDFSDAEAQMGASPVTLISYAFWKRQFDGDPAIVGKAISLDTKPVTVVGVLPEAFDFGAVFSPGSKVDLFTPQIMDAIRTDGDSLSLVGRMKPGVTLARATAELRTIAPQLYWGKRDPASKGSYGPMEATSLKEHVAGELRRSLAVLWGAVGLILLIACVNLSNLLIARATVRAKEFALRMALGAGKGRLIRQLVTESAILSVAGTALGLGIAFGVTTWLAHQGSVALPLLAGLRMDSSVLLWTLGIALATSLLLGLAPAFKMTGTDLQGSLKDAGLTASAGRRHERVRVALVISEVALACVLVVGAGLLLRSFLHVMDIDLGFRPSQAATLPLDVDNTLKLETRSAFYANLLHEISSIRGVETAGISDNLPLTRNRSWGPPGVKGVDYPRNARPTSLVYIVSPGYFGAMGIRLEGRDFTWQDAPKSEKVVVINRSAAAFLFPHEDAVGRILSFQETDVRIVAVTPDVHTTGAEANAGWQIYLPIAQGWGEFGAQLVIRSSLPTGVLGPAVMKTLRSLNPGQPLVELQPVQHIVDHATSPRRFFAVLITIFALLGLILASLGIYGVISYSVTRQTQEIGIRMALGASQGSVQRRIISATLRMALIGVAIGTIASLAMSRLISSLLFGTEASDPATFAATVAILVGVAITAAYLPARRASRINPMVALRNS